MTVEATSLVELPRLVQQSVEIFANIGKRPYLLEANKKFTSFSRSTTVWGLGIDNWFRLTFSREGRVWSLAKYGVTDFKDLVTKSWQLVRPAKEGIEIAGEMALADRIGNETRQLAFADPKKSNVWRLLADARENPLINDHGWPHERRKERLSEMIMMGVDFLRHGPENIKRWILIPFLENWTHDSDQAMTQQRNLENNTELKSKIMHNAAAAIRSKLLQPYLESAAEIQSPEAERVLAALAVINLLHDEPEKINMRLEAAGQAVDYREDPQLLYDQWEPGEVNVFSLTYGDVMTILRIGKEKGGFVTQKTPNGLDPDCEKVFKKRLASLSHNHRRTLGEIINFKDESDKKAFRHTLDICLIPDLMDMYIPADESMLRKFLTPFSQNRPLFRNTRRGRFIRAIKGSGNIEAEKDSDLRRMIWEIKNSMIYAERTTVGQDPFIRQMIASTAVSNLQALLIDFPVLMAGSLEPVNRIYQERQERLKRKARKKLQLNPAVMEEKLAAAIKRLEVEREAVIKSMRAKPYQSEAIISGDGLVVYSEKDRSKAVQLMLAAAADMGLTDLQSYPTIKLPYFCYDPLSAEVPKVIHNLW